MSILDSIPLASKGTDYGVLGNEAVSSTATGRAYGLEIMGRWYNYKGLTFIASYYPELGAYVPVLGKE